MANVTRSSQTGRYEKRNSGGLKWFSNVAKSLGYTSSELITQIAPSMAEFTSVNANYAKELGDDIRSLRATGNRMKGAFNANSHVNIMRDAMRNAMSDLKSGNFYNKDRQDAMSSFDFDLGSDSDMGMIDFDMGDDSYDGTKSGNVTVPDVKVTVNTITPPIGRNNPMVKVMESQIQATYTSAKALNDTNVKLSQNAMIMSHTMHGRTLQGLQTINDNLALLVNFQNDSMGKYIGASLKYYEENLGLMQQSLDEIRKQNQSNQGQSPEYKSDPTDDVLLLNGGLNVKGYMSMVKSNLTKQMSENPMLSPLKAIFEDESTLKYLAASPLSFISTKIVTTMIPKFLQQSFGSLDKTFANFFPAMFMRLNKETLGSSNPLMQMLGEIFGLDIKTKSTVDLSRYNKGAVPFDGITRKTINEVIPGYLRKIHAALTGKEEIAFDHERGQFKTVSSMQKDFDNRKDSLITSAFSDSIDELKSIAETFPVESKKDRDAMMQGIEKFMSKLAGSNTLVNPLRTQDREGGSVDEIRDVYDFGGNTDMQRTFRQMILSMSKSSQTKMFGYNVMEARRQIKNMMSNAEMNPEMDNVSTLFNELGFDQHLDKTKTDSDGSFRINKGKGLLNPTDKFGFGQLDYLRDIKRILAHGIRVFVSKTKGGPGGGGPDYNPHDSKLKGMGKQETDLDLRDIRNNEDTIDTFDQSAKNRMSLAGQKPISGFSDLSSMSDDEISRAIKTRQDYLKNNQPEGKKTAFDFISNILKGDAKASFDTIRTKVDDLLKKPAELMQNVVTRIDNNLYRLVFGGGSNDDLSFMSTMMSKMKESFSKFFSWGKEKILLPLNESLFGKDGMITKLKDSDFMKSFKGKMKNIGDFVFGKPAGADGKREGGMMSDVANSFSDMWSGVKYYFNGKGYTNRAGISFGDNDKSVFSELKGMFGGFKTDMKSYLFGKKDQTTGERTENGLLGGAFDSLKQGFFNFNEAIFGPKATRGLNANTISQNLIEKVKARAPKSIAGGIIGGASGLVLGGGLLGTMVGGPMGAAIIGSTVAYLSQSEKFKNVMFGERDANGQRLGGMINKSTQEFFKKNRVGMIGGATLGAVKSVTGLGILPSFLLPGGPIGGVVLGIGASMLYRSEGFQRMMFGEKDADGKRVGGILQKAFGSNPQAKKIMGNVGAGTLGGAGLGLLTSHMGVMGALLIPGGPIGGAILGAAAGIALSSDRWKKALFGDFDEESGKRQGGLFGKFQNWFKLELMQPIQLQFKELNLKIKDWFTDKIGNPFREAIAPIRKEFKNMMDRMTQMFTNGWDAFKEKIGTVFEQHVGQPFGMFMKEKVMDPLKSFFSNIVKGVGRVFGAVLESPIKALTAISAGLTERHKKQGLNNFIDNERSDMFSREGRNDRRERGEKLGLLSQKDANGNVIGPGMLKRTFNMHFDRETRDKARTSTAGADYLNEPAISPEELKLQKARREQEWADLNHRKKVLKMAQKMGLKADYDNFDVRGNDISRIYDAHESITKMGKVSDNDRTMLSTIGLDVDQLMPGADMNNLNKKQKKQLAKMISQKLNTGVLKNTTNAMGGKDDSSGDDVVNAVDKVGGDIGDQTDKITSVIKEQSPKDVIKDSLVPAVKETTSVMHKVLAALERGKSSVSRSFRVSSNPKAPGSTSNSALRAVRKLMNPKDGDTHSHADGIDNVPHDGYNAELHEGEMVIPAEQANNIRGQAGLGRKIPSKMGSGQVNGSNRFVMGSLPKDRDSLIGRIASDVRIIASEVRGQLDGLGGNVFKIRKLVQKSMGASDEDMSGSANRDRVGFFGKMRRMMFKPFEAMRDQLMKGVDWVTGKIRAFGTAIKKVGDFVIGIPVKIAKSMWEFTKNVGEVLKKGALTLIEIPVQIGKLALGAMSTVVEAVKAVGPAVAKSLMGVATVFAGAMQGAAHAMVGFGKGVGNFLSEVGKGAGKVVVELGSMAASLTKNIGKLLTGVTSSLVQFTTSAVHTAVDFTLGTVKMLSEKLLDVGNSLIQLITSPLKFLGSAAGKLFNTGPKEVRVVGGHLDSIGTMEPIKLTDNKKDKPIRVIIVDTEKTIPVKMDSKGSGPVPNIIEPNHTVIPKSNIDLAGVKDTLGKTLMNIDAGNDRERIKEKAEATRKEKMSKVGFRTAGFLKGKLAEVEEKEFIRDSTTKQLSLLDKIRSAVTEHKDGWMSIFGPKGILTAAAMVALPFLKKIWDALAGFFNNGNGGLGNQSGTSAMDNALKYGVQRVAKFIPANKVVQGGKALINAGKQAYNALATSKVGQGIANAADKAAQATAKIASKITNSKVGQVVSKAVKTVTTPASTVAHAAEEGGAKVMTAIKNFFEKVMNNPKVAKVIGSGTSQVIKTILGEIGKFAKNPEFITKMLGGIAKGSAKVAASVSTAGLMEAGFAIWNATTGFINKGDAAYLFNVYEDEVTPKMRLVSSIMKTILGVSYIFILELLNAVVVQITGGKINVLLMIANSIHKAISDDDAYDDLSNAQIKFETDAAEAGYTKSAWNEKNNKTFETKVGEFTKKYWPKAKEIGKRTSEALTPLGMINSVKDSFNTDTVRQRLGLGEGTDVSFGQRTSVVLGTALNKSTFGLLDANKMSQGIANAGQWTIDAAKTTGKWIGNAAKSTGGWIADKATDVKDFSVNSAKYLANKAVDVTKGIGKGIAKGADAIWNSDQVQTARNLVTGIFNSTSNVMNALGEALSDIGSAVWDRIKDFGGWLTDKWKKGIDTIKKTWDSWIIEPFTKLGEDIKTKWTEAKQWFGENWKQWVTDPINNAFNNIKDRWVKVKESLAEIFEKWAIKPMLRTFKAVSTAWNKTKEWVGDNWDKYIVEPMGEKFQVIYDAWTATGKWIDEKWQTYIIDPAFTMIEKVKKLWDNITNLVGNAWDYVSGGVSDAWNNTVGGVKEVVTDTTSSISNGWNNFWGTNGSGVKEKMEGGSSNLSQDIKNLGSEISSAIRGDGQGGPKYDYNGKGGAAYTTGNGGSERTPIEVSQKVFNGFRVTSQFGLRADPFDKSSRAHNGIDLVKPDGSPIGAFVAGRVTYATTGKPGTGYNNMGNVVAIKDAQGATHVYAHLSSIGVKVGDQVQAGQTVGTQGSTGRSTGSHLHYEVRSGGFGTSIDPTQYIMNKGLKTVPGVTSGAATNITQGAVQQDPTTLDLFSKMADNFNLYATNMFTGEANAFNMNGDNSSGTPNGAVTQTGNSSVSLSGFQPLDVKNFTPAMQQSIAQKAVEMVIQGEGGRADSITKDYEPGSKAPRGMSLGLMQWNRGRAKQMVERMAAAAPGAGFEQFAGDPSLWGSSWWSDGKIQEFKNLINQNSSVATKVQQDMISSDVMSTNLSPIFRSGKLRDPRSIVMLSDIGNTGPAHISSFLNSYTPAASGQTEFPHFYDELKSKSWWARHMGVYGNRLNKTYSSLQGWNPSGFTNDAVAKGGQGGPAGPEVRVKKEAPKLLAAKKQPTVARANGIPLSGLVGNGFTDSYRSLQTSRVMIEGNSNASSMAEAVQLLKDIAINTGATTDGIVKLNAKENSIQIVNHNGDPVNAKETTTEETGKGGNLSINVSGGNKLYSSNPMIQSMNDAKSARANADYKKAKSIASGGRS